jgi:hypothetical protein
MTRARHQTHEHVNATKRARGSGGLAQEMRSAQPQVEFSAENHTQSTVHELDGRLTLVMERLVNWKVKATDYGTETDLDAVNNVRNQLGPLHELEVPIVTNNDATSYRAAVNKRSNFLQEGPDDDISDYSFEQALAIIDQLPNLFTADTWDENDLDRAKWAAKFAPSKVARMEAAWSSIAEADLKEIRKKTGSVKREVLLGKRFDESAAGRIIYAGTDAFNALTGPAQMVAMERLVTLLAHRNSAGQPTLVGDIEVMLGYKALDTALAWFITDRDSPSGTTRFPETVEGDFSRNDREQRSRVAHICDAWFKKLGMPEWYRELMFQLEHYTLVNYEFGLRVNLSYQLATGTTNTTFRNSIYNATMFAVCCRRQHRKGKALVLGDDLLAALNHRLDLKAWVADVASFKMVLKAKAPRLEGEATFLSRRLFTTTEIPFMIPQPEKAYFRFNARANPNPAMSDDQYICAKALSYAFSFQHCHVLRDIFLKRFHMNGSHLDIDLESIGWNNRQFGFTVSDIYDRTMTSPNLIEFGDLSFWITELYKDIDACDLEELFEAMICSNETTILDDPRAECFARFIG